MFQKITILLTILVFALVQALPTTVYADTMSNQVRSIILKKVPLSEAEAFIQKIEEVATRLNIKADELAAVMSFESAGTLDPAKRNPCSGCTAVGLIQFIRSTADGLGGKCVYARIATLSRVEQMDCVEAYLAPKLNKVSSPGLSDIYGAINWPISVGKPNNYVFYKDDPNDSNDTYDKNKVLDINGDGSVTKAEASQQVINHTKAWGASLNYDAGSFEPGEFEGGNGGWQSDDRPEISSVLPTAEDIARAETRLLEQYQQATKRSLENQVALGGFLSACQLNPNTFFEVDPTTSLVSCVRQIIQIIYVIAILYLVVTIAASQTGVILKSGTNAEPVEYTRRKIQDGLVGLALIGGIYLFTSIFSTSLNRIDLVSTPIVSDQIKTQYNSGKGLDKGSEITEYAVITSTTPKPIATNPTQSGRGEQPSEYDTRCRRSVTCKILQVTYINQVLDDQGEYFGAGGQHAAAAASGLMVANYLRPELFSITNGNNNTNLSLREQIFSASTYLKSQTVPRTCNAGISESLLGNPILTSYTTTVVDGALSITSSITENVPNAKVKDLSDLNNPREIPAVWCKAGSLDNISRLLSAYTISSAKNTFDPLLSPERIRAEIDAGRPVIVRSTRSRSIDSATLQHFFVVKGYAVNTDNSLYGFVVNDPWGVIDPLDTNNSPSLDGNGIIYPTIGRSTVTFEEYLTVAP